MKKPPFKTSKISKSKDTELETKLREYMARRYPWLTYYNSRKSYALRRFEFIITNSDLMGKKIAKELDEKLEMVLAAENCHAKIKKDRLVITIPREEKDTLYLGTGLAELMHEEKYPVRAYVGECDDGTAGVIDFNAVPHLMIAGATGSGKTVCLNDILLTLMYKYTPQEVNFFILDDKNELSVYKNEPHVIETAFDSDDFLHVLKRAESEMATRKRLIGDTRLAVNIDEYNRSASEPLPHLFIVFDEADVVLKKGSKHPSAAFAKTLAEEIVGQGRSLGIHLIIGTQKPIKDVIDTTIKSNIPGRIALHVTNHHDSNVILDESGAENLTGNGDALMKLNGKTRRIQCAFVDSEERAAAISQLQGGKK